MTDTFTGKRIVVRPVRNSGGTFHITVAQLPDVLAVLERNGFHHWPGVGRFTKDGVNWITGVDIGIEEDLVAVQAALDAVE